MIIDTANTSVIAEFRANGGAVTEAMGGALQGLDLLLLHHVGRRTGRPYVTPLSYLANDDSFLLMGSFAGSPVEPQWVASLEAAPQVAAEFGTRTIEVTATVLRDGPQRANLCALQIERWPFVRDYESRADRPFPVIRLTPIG